MGDAMSDKDEKCIGCDHWAGSYSFKPCSSCSRVFSGQTKDYYTVGSIVPKDKVDDAVKHPKHYMLCDTEAIDIIRQVLSPEELKGYILGNVLKYRLRAGKKGGSAKTQEDIHKSLQYEEMYERYLG